MVTRGPDPSSRRRYYAPQPYGYRPTFGWTTAAASVFLFTFLVHLVQVIYYIVRRRKAQRPDTTKDADAEGLTGQHSTGRRPPKYWFILATLVPAALLETIGWWMRWRTLWEYYATEAGPFLAQYIILILAPCFIAAFNYTLLGLGVQHLGEEYSLLKGTWYVILFTLADVAGSAIQIAGGSLSASRYQRGGDATVGTNTIVAGLAIQLAATITFVALGLDFIFRLLTERPRRVRQPIEMHTPDPERGTRKRWMVLLVAVFFSAAMLVMRAVYRTVDYAKGWPAYREIRYTTPDKQELYFGVFDFLPMFLSLLLFNIVHPGLILGSRRLFK